MARYRRRLCLAVDLRQYSRHGYRAQEDAQYRLRLVVEHALRRARVLRVRAQQQVQGDGQLVVFPARIDAVRVVPALILGLRDGLYQANRTPGAFGRMRMRAALALGSVSRADRGYLGDSVVLVNRLADADGLRDALENEDGSDLALAVPDEMYRDVILPDGRGLAAEFHRIDVAVVKKEFACGAWLYVPPSAPVRDSRPEPVIWGHSPAHTAMREFVVPALGVAHVAAAVISHGQTLREWALAVPDTGVSYGGGNEDFDGPDEMDARDGDSADGHRTGGQQPGAHHWGAHQGSAHLGSGHHGSGHPGTPRLPGPHHADVHHTAPHYGDLHHPDSHGTGPHHQDAHHDEVHHPAPYHADLYHQDADYADAHHDEVHHPAPYHGDPYHQDPYHPDPHRDDPGHHDPVDHDPGHHFHHGGH
ncbi:hypothetical protein G9272_15340 [Streptomyces asoensis]|uniref:Uncharacterized protein n=1 Tax=Streptomyces asoensis TaxID=249586 RepID=A0A6M4WP82_9ACTN|nr:hypothetical protein [Streptomyces asoensis]QJT01521.1 hypothetical protein G9272_15340 [Streptomyces asoensis]